MLYINCGFYLGSRYYRENCHCTWLIITNSYHTLKGQRPCRLESFKGLTYRSFRLGNQINFTLWKALKELKHYSLTVADNKAFVLVFLRLVDRLYTVIHKMQKTRAKVLPSAAVGEYYFSNYIVLFRDSKL